MVHKKEPNQPNQPDEPYRYLWRLTRAMLGIMVAAGALAAWYYLNIDGFLAFIIVILGLNFAGFLG